MDMTASVLKELPFIKEALGHDLVDTFLRLPLARSNILHMPAGWKIIGTQAGDMRTSRASLQ